MDLYQLLIQPLTYEFMQRALLAALLIGGISGVIGCFIVVRGMSQARLDMPIHDWTHVPPGLFHHFHQDLSIEIARNLNRGRGGERISLTVSHRLADFSRYSTS